MSDNFLLDAVQRLTSTSTTRVEQVNDYTGLEREPISCVSTVTHEPLLILLRDAVAGGIGSHKGSTSARERIPFDTGALELFDGITRQINAWYLALPEPKAHLHINTRLTRWYLWFENERRAGRVTLSREADTLRLLEGWVSAIENMFDPPIVLEITAPCPVCGQRWAFDPKTGDQITAVLIQYKNEGQSMLDKAHGLCRSCETVWSGRSALRELSFDVESLERAHESA